MRSPSPIRVVGGVREPTALPAIAPPRPQSFRWRRELSKQKGRVEFYRKIEMALEAGYYIVPPYPLDIFFAIRTQRIICRRRRGGRRRHGREGMMRAITIFQPGPRSS